MRDLVVYAAGGGMRGVFGAGVLQALAELGVRDHVQAFYGISAGAFNVAHFALGSTMRAMQWYLRDVPDHGIVARSAPMALLRGDDLVDLPEAERVLETEHFVDAEGLAQSVVPVSFGVVERDTLTFRWLDARRPDALQVLLASSTIFPFVHETVVVDGVPYIDGGYREAVGYRRLRRRHPEAELVLVLNDNEHESIVRRVAVGTLLRLRDERLAEAWRETIAQAPTELAEALAAPHTLVFRPRDPFPVHFSTTHVATLEHGFERGYRAALNDRRRLLRLLHEPTRSGAA
jgi:predicted patatin/cPLA2 family phospholipase